MTATTAVPTPLVLPGQAASPTGPIDLTPMYLVHHAFRRDLADVVAAVRATPLDDRGTWQALVDRWDRFSMVLHHHHGGEDSGLWPLLQARATEEGAVDAVEVLAAMAAEHGQIDPLLASVADGLAVLAESADADARAALEVRASAARELLDRHMAHEERDALALVQRLLTPEQWAAMEKEHFAGTATREYMLFVLPWIRHGLPPAGVRAFGGLGGLPLVLLERVLRPGFLRGQRRAFAHVRAVA